MNWRRTLTVAWISQLLCTLGFGSFHSFLPFYIQDLGVTDLDQVKLWTGWITTGGSLSMAIFAPIWGSLADRYGRKIMVVRATFASTIILALMAFVSNVPQLLILRTIQGTMSGTVAAFTTLVAACIPKGKEGSSLGLMQVAVFSGSTGGPLLGGFVADALGYRAALIASSIALFIGGLLVLILVQERFVPAPRRRAGVWRNARALLGDSNVLSMALVVLALYTTSTTVRPILPLFVQSLGGAEDRLATISGSIQGVTALTSAIAAAIIGRLSDRLGHGRVLVIACLGAALAYVPMTFVQTPLQLLALNILVGIFVGGLLPTTNAIIALNVEREKQGATYGLTASSGAAGRAIGPMLGSTIAVTMGNRALFPTAAIMYTALSASMAFTLLRRKTRVSAGAPADVVPQPDTGRETP